MNKNDNVLEYKRLAQDITYYNNVFKKIEKVSSVILYIISFNKDNITANNLQADLEKKSFALHEQSLLSLQKTAADTDVLWDVHLALTSLMSSLQLATAARYVSADMTAVVVEQIDAVQRYLTNHYLTEAGIELGDLHEIVIAEQAARPTATKKAAPQTRPGTAATRGSRPRRSAIPQGDISSDAYLVYSQLNDRTERIKTVLEAKPQATVKDIAEIITDVSEKTIQRDLNSLIEKGQVVREGERRWSKYSVVKD